MGILLLVITLVVLLIGYYIWKQKPEKEPLYIKYKTDLRVSASEVKNPFRLRCLICNTIICNNFTQMLPRVCYVGNVKCYLRLCYGCEQKIYNKEILKKQGLSLDLMEFDENYSILLPILNLVQIDLERGNISESDAKRITNETVKEMIENATGYKIIKKGVGGKRLNHHESDKYSYVFWCGRYCVICGDSEWRGHCSSCETEYKKDLNSGKFPNKLKEVLYEIPWDYRESYFTFEDWRYLHLIAKDLERGYIEKSEALAEAERYIDLIYDDIKAVPAKIAAKENATPEPAVKTESEKFMDDILS